MNIALIVHFHTQPPPQPRRGPGQRSISSGMRSRTGVREQGIEEIWEGALNILSRRYSGCTESLYTFRERKIKENSFPDDLCRLNCD